MSFIQHSKININWTHLFALWALQGFFALWGLASLPSDAEGGLLLGLSASRLTGLAFLLAWSLVNIGLAVKSQRDADRTNRRLDSVFISRAGDILLVLSLLVALFSQGMLAILWGLSQRGEIFKYTAYATRVAPILNLVTVSALELLLWIVLRKRSDFNALRSAGLDLLKRGVVVWGVLGALAILVIATGLGIVPDNTGEWGLPGVPLLEWQIFLVCILCVLVMIFETRPAVEKIKRLDLWIAVAIWLGTSLLWLSQPVIPSISALPPRAPNHEIYPFIDAQIYHEYAQSILIGNGLHGTEIPPRPLYIVFLAFLHAIVGQSYNNVIAAQSLLLAFLPVALYWMGKDFYGRPVGIGMAVLAALRDVTSNFAAPFSDNLSYSKLFLSELPAAVFLVLFIWLTMRWARRNYPGFLAFIAGGFLGIGILIRTQSVAALPVVLFLTWLVDWKKFAPILRGALLMLLGIALVVSPWIWRNYRNTGQFIFDSPGTQTINLAWRYSALNDVEADVIQHPDETNAEYNERLTGIFLQAVRSNPGGAIRAVVNRFLNNCVNNILILPLRNKLLSPAELWQPGHAFWQEWRGQPTASQGTLLGFYLFLFGLGIAASWKRLGILGLIPLGVTLFYNLWTSTALLSGQRFLLGMDWAVYMYYMVGLFVLVSGFMYLLNGARPFVLKWIEISQLQQEQVHPAKPLIHYTLIGALFFVVGASIPLSEMVFPKRYPLLTQEQLWTEFSSSRAFADANLDAACMSEFIAQNELQSTNGRAVSPRFYGPGEGELLPKAGYGVSDQGRLVFVVTGNYNGLAILETAQSPEFFPNISDVVIYFDKNEPAKAWFVLLKNEGQEELYLSDEFKSYRECGVRP